MKKLGVLVTLILFAFAPTKLVKTKVGDRITVALPTELAPMTNDDIALRYPSVRAPLGAFTNRDRDTDFSVNVSATEWVQADIEIAAQFFKAGIYNLYDRVDIISSGIQTINKKKFIFYEFESRINGNKMKEAERQPVLRYSYVQYYIEKGKTLVFAFNCPREQRQKWQSSAHEIMKSIKLK
jgi:hypothetical protein